MAHLTEVEVCLERGRSRFVSLVGRQTVYYHNGSRQFSKRIRMFIMTYFIIKTAKRIDIRHLRSDRIIFERVILILAETE